MVNGTSLLTNGQQHHSLEGGGAESNGAAGRPDTALMWKGTEAEVLPS